MFVINGIPIDYVLCIIGGLMMAHLLIPSIPKNPKVAILGGVIFGIGFVLAGIALLLPYFV